MSGIQIIFSLKYVRWPLPYHGERCWPYAQSDLFKKMKMTRGPT